MVKPYGTDHTHWLHLTPSDWMDRYIPGWRRTSYGDLLQADPADWLRWMQPRPAVVGGPPASLYPYGQSGYESPYLYGYMGYGAPHPWGCRCPKCARRECRRCGCDPCECVCCIGDVDLVMYARVGEQRVIPIVVENPRRREKSVTVELGNWRTRGGGAVPVDTVDIEPKAFTLPPCGEQKITLVVSVRPLDQTSGDQQSNGGKRDVDTCLVATADLTLVGCDHRPIRIAVAILPRDCDPFRIDCGCGCC